MQHVVHEFIPDFIEMGKRIGGRGMMTKIRKVYMGVPVPSWPKAGFDINIDIQKLENIVRSHLEDDKGSSLQVLMRIGQKVTVAKLVGLSTMLISTGEIIASPDVDRGCRTKITTKVPNARKMLDNWSGGLHRLIFYGDWVDEVINLGKLLSYNVFFEG